MLDKRVMLVMVLLVGACGDDPGSPRAPLVSVPAADRTALITHVGRLAHDSMVGRGSTTLDERRAAQYIEQQFASYGLEGAAFMTFVVAGATVTSQNVLAALPGTGSLRDDWIVLGAHYDHVGKRQLTTGDSAVYNGADDNASGTAVILELARLLAGHARNNGFGEAPRRSVLFIAFGAEELGLIGSERFCAQPTIPLARITAMLNFDMVGRLRNNTLAIGGQSTALDWPQLLDRRNTDHLVLKDEDCPACTDYACFRRAGRPVLWFFTGLHPEYHQPTDDVELINQPGLGQIADLAARVTADLMVRESGLRALLLD